MYLESFWAENKYMHQTDVGVEIFDFSNFWGFQQIKCLGGFKIFVDIFCGHF